MASKLEELEAPSWTDFLAQYAKAVGRAQRVPGQMAIGAAKGMAQTIEDAKRESLSAAFGGDYNPKPVLELGMMPMGGTAVSAPKGALGAGPARPPFTDRLRELEEIIQRAKRPGAPPSDPYLVSKGDITKALEAAPAMPAVHTPKYSKEFVPEIDTAGWTQVGPRGGVSPGGLYRTPTGEDFYLKSGPEGHVQTERIARELYGLTGAPVPQTYRAVREGHPAIASKIIPGKTLADLYPSYTVPESVTKDLSKHMATDLWLKNTDLHGHNVLVPTAGKPARIDFGAALDYNPFGEKRAFSSSPSDVKWDQADIMGSHIYGKRPDFGASAREALLRLPQEEVVKALSATEETKRLIGPALERRREILRQFLPDEKIDTILVGLAGGGGGAAAALDPEMRSILEALQAHQKKEGK